MCWVNGGETVQFLIKSYQKGLEDYVGNRDEAL